MDKKRTEHGNLGWTRDIGDTRALGFKGLDCKMFSVYGVQSLLWSGGQGLLGYSFMVRVLEVWN